MNYCFKGIGAYMVLSCAIPLIYYLARQSLFIFSLYPKSFQQIYFIKQEFQSITILVIATIHIITFQSLLK